MFKISQITILEKWIIIHELIIKNGTPNPNPPPLPLPEHKIYSTFAPMWWPRRSGRFLCRFVSKTELWQSYWGQELL